MGSGKPAIQSVAVWGGFIALLAGAAQLIGYTISPDDQTAIVNLIQSGMALYVGIASFVSGAMAIWGRVHATKPITGIVSSK